MTERDDLTARTIADFGDQWTRFRDNGGYYASSEYLEDLLAPLLRPEDLRGQRVGDIGSGSGRIVGMLLAVGVAKVYAFEPSAAYEVLRDNVAHAGERVELHRARGDEIPAGLDLDTIVSIGVVHHIPDPNPVVAAAFAALRPGGRLFLWLYGAERNEWYLRCVRPLRFVCTRLPHRVLVAFSVFLNRVLDVYIAVARRVRLPLRDYLLDVFVHLDDAARVLVIYDQLNPAYAKYYRRAEALALLRGAGFDDVRVHHRHGYSWSVVGTRPAESQ